MKTPDWYLTRPLVTSHRTSNTKVAGEEEDKFSSEDEGTKSGHKDDDDEEDDNKW